LKLVSFGKRRQYGGFSPVDWPIPANCATGGHEKQGPPNSRIMGQAFVAFRSMGRSVMTRSDIDLLLSLKAKNK